MMLENTLENTEDDDIQVKVNIIALICINS